MSTDSYCLTGNELLGRRGVLAADSLGGGDLPHAEVGQPDDEVGGEELLELCQDRLADGGVGLGGRGLLVLQVAVLVKKKMHS